MPKRKAQKKNKSKRPTEQKPIPLQTIRIKAKDLHAYKKTKNGWRKAKIFLPEAIHAVKLFKAHKKFDVLIDKKDSRFLKGMLLKDGSTRGARINILPDGQRLDKAFSLFAKHLTFHDEESHDHWDVLYQNKGGTFSYVYTLEKKARLTQKKYKQVQNFARYYSKLYENVCHGLRDEQDYLAVPMYTLLKTFMRIGNQIYYRAHGHKGLTTIKKHDIKIDGNNVFFNYVGKDGVPLNIKQFFPITYIKRLESMLKNLDDHSFVFTNPKTGNPLSEQQFKKAFERYCGKEFYPHIVRSYYATTMVKQFLKTHKNPSKEEVNNLLLSIAAKLGHKKFDKKQAEWKEDYTVTLNNYVQPELAQRIKSLK